MALRNLVFAAVALLLTSPAWSAGAAVWERDFDLMLQRLRALHPQPWTEIGETRFMRAAQEVRSGLAAANDDARAAAVIALFARLEDQGTSVDLTGPEQALWYPFRLYDFAGRYHFTSVLEPYAELAGAELLEVGGRPAHEVIERARDVMSSNSEHQRREHLFAFHNAALMRGIGLARGDGSLAIRARLRDGTVVERVLPAGRSDSPLFGANDASYAWTALTELYGTPLGEFQDWITVFDGARSLAFRELDATRPLHLQKRRVFHSSWLPERDALYVQVNAVSDARDQTFDQFLAGALAEAVQRRPRRMILDFRFNGGGDGSKAAPLARRIVRLGDTLPWQELYVLVGRRTAGAAVAVIDAIADQVPLTVVGEPAGAGPTSSSESVTFAYPDIGLRQHVSTRHVHLGNSDDLARHVRLDVPVTMAFADYAAGKDPAVDRILAGEEMRSLQVIAINDSGAAARAAYTGRPVAFDDVKSLGYRLLDGKRAQDAREIFELMTLWYPAHWNSWESLGRAQAELGLAAEARASNRCALALDPQNWDAPGLRQSLEGFEQEAAAMPRGCPATRPVEASTAPGA